MTGLEIILAAGLILLALLFVVTISFKDTSEADKPALSSAPSEVEEEEKEADISEPVLSFVRVVKENPKRFSTKLDKDRKVYVFKDKQLSKSWDFSYYLQSGYLAYSELSIEGVDWLTRDEKYFILLSLSPIFMKERRDRLHDLQRERMKRLYK